MGTSTEKEVGANEWATLTDYSTDTGTGTGTGTLPPPANPGPSPANPGPTKTIDGHPVGSTCDQCYQLALRESQKAGFTASKQFIHNFGKNIFPEAPQLCDIHWRNPNGGPQEVFTACDCSCLR